MKVLEALCRMFLVGSIMTLCASLAFCLFLAMWTNPTIKEGIGYIGIIFIGVVMMIMMGGIAKGMCDKMEKVEINV